MGEIRCFNEGCLSFRKGVWEHGGECVSAQIVISSGDGVCLTRQPRPEVEKGHCRTCGKELPEPQMVLCSGCFDKNGHTPGVRITAPENRSSYEIRLCPKCGSEMKPKEVCESDGHDNYWRVIGYVCKCGHEERFKDGEKPPVVVGFEKSDGTQVVAEFDSSITDFIDQRLRETKKPEVEHK